MTRIWKFAVAAGFIVAGLTSIACGFSSTSNEPSKDSTFIPDTTVSAAATGPAALAGTLLVGKDIAPGTYQGTATGYCYVARMGKGESDIIDNDLYQPGDKVTLTVKATDYAVKIDRSCGLAK